MIALHIFLPLNQHQRNFIMTHNQIFRFIWTFNNLSLNGWLIVFDFDGLIYWDDIDSILGMRVIRLGLGGVFLEEIATGYIRGA